MKEWKETNQKETKKRLLSDREKARARQQRIKDIDRSRDMD